MRRTIYNQAILNMVNRAERTAPGLRPSLRVSFFVFTLVIASWAGDWSGPEQQLARKIAAVTGPGAVALTVQNRSSLSKRDSDVITNGLRAALETAGLRFVKPEQSAASIEISLSENASSYVWVAEIHQGSAETSVVMVPAPRAEGMAAAHDSVPLSISKTSLWSQEDRILDVVVLEEAQAPTHIAVLDAEKVTLYRMQGGKWQPEQSMNVSHARPWPRDLRGRLVPGNGNLFNAYLPGVVCRTSTGAPLSLSCHESDDPWPLVAFNNAGTNFPSFGAPAHAPANSVSMGAFFASNRNFFTGALTPGVGKFTTVPKFYSAAFLPREKYSLWLFASIDGQTHIVDGMTDLAGRVGWGSDLTSLRTACGSGWQVLATNIADQNSSVRAYELPDREAVAVSAPVDLGGEVTALWTENKGDTAIVVTRNRETDNYEASRLALACGQ